MANALPRLFLAVSVLGTAACESDAQVEIGPPVAPVELTPTPDETPDAEVPPGSGGVPCGEAVCEPRFGLARTCGWVLAVDPTEAPIPTCVPELGPAYRLVVRDVFLVDADAALSAELTGLFADAVDDVVLTFGDLEVEPVVGFIQSTTYLVEGVVASDAGGVEGRAGRTRSFRFEASVATGLLNGPPDQDPIALWVLGFGSVNRTRAQLRLPPTTVDGVSCAAPLALGSAQMIRARRDGEGHRLEAKLSLCVSEEDADGVVLSDGRTLREALQSNPLQIACDLAAGGSLDAWTLSVEADLTPVEFVGDPAAFVGASVDTPDCP